MEIEDKFRKFDITNEMAESFRYFANGSKHADDKNENYVIKTIVLGEHEVHFNEQGDGNAELG